MKSNIFLLQQLEQTILAQQTTPHNQQQQRVQQILQQELQQQIKQFQQQVEQQLAYTQHAGPVLPPPLPQGPPPGKKSSIASMMSITTATTTTGTISGEGGGGEPPEVLDLGAGYVDMSSETVQTTDLNFLMCGEQLQGFMAGPGEC